MRTTAIEKYSEPKGHNRSHSPNSRAKVFQGGSSSHGISVEVKRPRKHVNNWPRRFRQCNLGFSVCYSLLQNTRIFFEVIDFY